MTKIFETNDTVICSKRVMIFSPYNNIKKMLLKYIINTYVYFLSYLG